MKFQVLASGSRRLWIVVAGLLAASTVCGRAIEETPDDILRYHVLAIDKTGSAMLPSYQPPSGTGSGDRVFLTPMDGEDTRQAWPFELQDRKPLYNYLSEMFAHARAQLASGEVERVAIFVHGGMNSLDGAAKRALDLHGPLRAARAYPIFIAWDSNLFSTYGDHLLSVRNGKRNPLWAALTTPAALLADVGGAVVRSPLDVMNLFGNDLHALHPYWFQDERAADRQYRTLSAVDMAARKTGNRTGKVRISEGEDERKLSGDISDVAKWAATTPIKMVTTPMVASLGRPAWSNMLRHTRTMYERESEYAIFNKDAPNEKWWAQKDELTVAAIQGYEKRENQRAYDGRLGAMEIFLNRFSKELASDHHIRIDAVGHSMGTIVLNAALVRHPEIRFQNIVYLAAACSVAEFKRAVIPYLVAHQQDDTHFYNLCLHPSCERAEQNPGKLDLTARGSLLVWIDNFLAEPESEQDRTYGRWVNCLLQSTSADIPSNVAGKITLKAFGRKREPEDGIIDPEKHGEMLEYDKTRKSLFWAEKFWAAEVGSPPRVRGYD